MREVPLLFGLGHVLRKHCRAGRLTQAELARRCGLSVPTIRLLETGRGNPDSFRAVLAVLDLELVSRNLPAGPSLRPRLAALRRHRELSQRELAQLIEVSQPTIVGSLPHRAKTYRKEA